VVPPKLLTKRLNSEAILGEDEEDEGEEEEEEDNRSFCPCNPSEKSSLLMTPVPSKDEKEEEGEEEARGE